MSQECGGGHTLDSLYPAHVGFALETLTLKLTQFEGILQAERL